MTTLTEAWDWYQATRSSLRNLERLADKHWGTLPWDGDLGRDQLLRDAVGPDVLRESQTGQQPLADLAVLVLFSVFESIVRGAVRAQVASEATALRHPSLVFAAQEAIGTIEEGSFFRVLEPYKGYDSGMIEEVNQVRRYRNWVAHGRRGDPPGNPPIKIEPRTAYDRLARFLATILPPPAPAP